MKDPRAALYAKLEESESTDLITETKAYFEHVIGKSGASNAKAVELQATIDEQKEALKANAESLKELEALRASATDADKENVEIRKELKTLTDAHKESEAQKAELQETKRIGDITTSLTTSMKNVDPVTRAGAIGAMLGLGYDIDGKKYKADTVDGETTITANGETFNLENGVAALMESGLKNHIKGIEGGAPPAGSGGDAPSVSLTDAVNGWNKKD